MGLMTMFHASGTDPKELVPVVPPVGVYPEFIRNEPTTLVLKEAKWSMSGDDFSIKDANTDKSVLKCSGSTISLHDRKSESEITSAADGKLLYNMAEKMIAIHKTITCEGIHGRKVLTVKKKWSAGSKLSAEFNDAEDKEHTLHLNGDMFGNTANVTLSNGAQLAHISRKLVSMNDMVADKQTYYVTIAPGVDISLMATLVICFDEVMNEEKENK